MERRLDRPLLVVERRRRGLVEVRARPLRNARRARRLSAMCEAKYDNPGCRVFLFDGPYRARGFFERVGLDDAKASRFAISRIPPEMRTVAQRRYVRFDLNRRIFGVRVLGVYEPQRVLLNLSHMLPWVERLEAEISETLEADASPFKLDGVVVRVGETGESLSEGDFLDLHMTWAIASRLNAMWSVSMHARILGVCSVDV